MTPIKRWKKFVCVSCSHAQLLKPSVRYEVLTFCQNFAPDTIAHLGDWIDTNELRAGGNHTEGGSISLDIEAGFEFVRELFDYATHQRHLFCGNHENRIWRLCNDTRPMVAELAQKLVLDIYGFAEKQGAMLYEYRDGQMWRRLGGAYIGHGILFNEMCARDTAEMLGGTCIFGHSHRFGSQQARTLRDAVGYNIGWLGDREKAHYAHTRRQTQAWQNGFAFGWYTDENIKVELYKCREARREEVPAIG